MIRSASWQELFAELRRRKVFRVATIYVVSLWPLVQLADILQPALGFPDHVISTLLYLFIGGFPVALVMAWLFDITRDGIVRTPVAGSEDAASAAPVLSGRAAEALLIGALSALVLALFAVKAVYDREAEPQPAATPDVAAAPSDSIAVLPFAAFGSAEQDQVFADGLTEEVLNRLARVPGLRVAARTSSFAYKGVNRNVQQVGHELGVARILEGSVRRSDVSSTIRITAQLVDVASGTHLWSQTYDREYRDVLRIQDEIAVAVAGQLSLGMQEEATAGGADRAASPEALLLVSRARAALARRNAPAVTEAIALLEQGVRESPNWAQAHASLAEACVLGVLYAGAAPEEYLAKAQRAVDRALELDPGLGAAWASQGLVHMQYPERTAAAREALERAITLNPSHAMATMWLGSLQTDPARTLALHRRALELDPRSAVAAYNVATDLLEAGRENEAMEVFDQIVAADPFYPGAYRLTAQINERHGRLDEAVLDYRRAWRLDQDAGTAGLIARLLITLGQNDQARPWAERARGGAPLQQLGAMWLQGLLAFTDGDAQAGRQWVERIARAAAGQGDIGGLFSGFAWSLLERHAEAAAAFDGASRLPVERGFKLARTDVLDAYVMAVRSYRAVGRTGDADRMLATLREEVAVHLAPEGRPDPHYWYLDASRCALEGDATCAIGGLRRAVAEGWLQGWRLDIDPVWDGLRHDAAFNAIRQEVDDRLAGLARSLARESGEMP